MLFGRSVLLQLVLSSVSQRNMPNDVLRAPTLRRRMKHNFRISYDSRQLMNENWHIFAIPMHTAITNRNAILEFGADVVDVILHLRLQFQHAPIAIASTSARQLNNLY